MKKSEIELLVTHYSNQCFRYAAETNQIDRIDQLRMLFTKKYGSSMDAKCYWNHEAKKYAHINYMQRWIE